MEREKGHFLSLLLNQCKVIGLNLNKHTCTDLTKQGLLTLENVAVSSTTKNKLSYFLPLRYGNVICNSLLGIRATYLLVSARFVPLTPPLQALFPHYPLHSTNRKIKHHDISRLKYRVFINMARSMLSAYSTILKR